MNWEAVAAIAEAVGALAVFVSLVYLAYQIRQNTASIKASSYDSFVSHTSSLAALLLSNEDLGRAWGRGLAKPDELNPTDRQRFHSLMLRFYRQLESAHRQSASGLIEPDLFGVWWQEALQYAREPGAAAWWRANRQFFTTTFREFANRELGLRGS
jgi:hypothetical protein